MPTFARPIAAPVAQPAAASSTLSPAMTFVCLATLSCAALFLFARPDGAQNLPGSKSGVPAHKQTAAAVAKPAAAEEAAPAASADRQDLSFYTTNVRDGMFSAPVPPAPVAPPVVVTKPHIEIKPITVEPINPFLDWNYTGTVHMGDTTIALLENWRTGDGMYVKLGDSFGGAKITSLTDQEISLAPAVKGSKAPSLAKGNAIVITPLNYDAPGKNPQQQQQQMQVQNGQQPGQAGVPAATTPNQPVVLGRNGQPITDPQQAAAYQQRLDARFNGGGGGNNGGGGGNFNGGGGGGNFNGGGGRGGRGGRGGGG